MFVFVVDELREWWENLGGKKMGFRVDLIVRFQLKFIEKNKRYSLVEKMWFYELDQQFVVVLYGFRFF